MQRTRIQFWWPFLPEPTCTPFPPTLLDWLSGSLLNWVVIQLKSSASALLAGGETDHSMHAWIYYFCCCYYPWQGYGIWDPRPVASLASVLSLSPPHNKVGLNVSREGFRADKMLPFFYRESQDASRWISKTWGLYDETFIKLKQAEMYSLWSAAFAGAINTDLLPLPQKAFGVGGWTTLRSLCRAELWPFRHSCDHLHLALWI